MNTKSPSLNIFSVVIQHFNNFITNEECSDVIEKCKTFNFKKHNAFNDNAVSSHNTVNNLLNNFSKLKETIMQKINNYENELGLNKSKLENSWINFQYKNSILKKHTHPNCQISGVLYLKTDEKSSRLYFYNPNQFNSFLNIKEYNFSNCQYIYFRPKIGDLILFPSWLSHGSHEDENLSEERVALSFNTR
jgi:uncharacterized protein (TIGR02466 family)